MDNLGNVAHLSHCGLEMEDVEKSRPCHMGQCNATYWDAMDWEFCNVPCGGGKSFREIICRSQFQIAKDSDCSQLPPPMMEKVCNTHVIIIFFIKHIWLYYRLFSYNGLTFNSNLCRYENS